MQEAEHHNKRFKNSKDDKLRRESEEAEKRARLKQRGAYGIKTGTSQAER